MGDSSDSDKGETTSQLTVIHGTAKNTSDEPPNKKLKQTEPQSPTTRRDDKSGETSHNAQERNGSIMPETGRVIKEEEPSESDHALQLNAEGKTHTFQFRIMNGKINKVVCDASKTVFGALNENKNFKRFNKEGKEIIIRRSKGKKHKAAVKTDFPCCLIEDDETLQINFYEAEKNASTNQETTTDTDPKRLVIFYIRTRGMTRKTIMKSNKVFSKNNIDYVCVFAHKGDTIEEALQHDGRFIEDIFEDDCNLVDDKNALNQMNLKVAIFDRKTFELKLDFKSKKQQDPVLGDKNDGEAVKHSQQPASFPKEEKTKSTDPSTEGNATQNTSGNSSGDSGDSFFTDIQNILHPVLKDVLNQLKQPEFLQKEYDKGVDECFTVVNKVRRVMELSDSVCVIEMEDSAEGTGFLLFDRFILTNAHVVQKFVYSPAPHTHKLSQTLTAKFNYEVVGSETINLKVKSDLIAYRYEKDGHRCHDFALLELDAPPDNCTELLSCYKNVPSPNSGGIYIVGHPESDRGVKKMDPCFIIESENRPQSIKKHRFENVSCPYLSWNCLPKLYNNQITYNSCFFHGSSGSPVFDAHCNLIGMHTGGFDYKEGKRTRSVIEFSYSMQSIVESIITQVNTRSDILNLLSKFDLDEKMDVN